MLEVSMPQSIPAGAAQWRRSFYFANVRCAVRLATAEKNLCGSMPALRLVSHSKPLISLTCGTPARGASKIRHLPEKSQIDAKPRVGIVWANQLPEGPDRPEPPPLFPRVSCENCETAAPISTGVVRPPHVRERDQSRMIALRDYGNGMSWVGSFRLPCGQPVRPLGD
jgi:hypothetical protein